MQNKILSLLVDNTSGVLSRIAGMFSRRGYNIDSITAGVTADVNYTRITVVCSGDDAILDQIVKQLAKLVDVRDIKVLDPSDSVVRETVLVKVAAAPGAETGNCFHCGYFPCQGCRCEQGFSHCRDDRQQDQAGGIY